MKTNLKKKICHSQFVLYVSLEPNFTVIFLTLNIICLQIKNNFSD